MHLINNYIEKGKTQREIDSEVDKYKKQQTKSMNEKLSSFTKKEKELETQIKDEYDEDERKKLESKLEETKTENSEKKLNLEK